MRAVWAALLVAACTEPTRPGSVARPPPQPVRSAAAPPPEPLPRLLRDPFLTASEEEPEMPAARPARKAAPLHLEALVVPPDGRGKVAIIDGQPYAEGDRVGEEVLRTIAVDHIELVSTEGARRTVRFDDGGPRRRDAVRR